MTWLHTKESATRLALTHRVIFASREGQTTVWEALTFMRTEPRKMNLNIQDITNSVMKVGKRFKETWFISSRRCRKSSRLVRPQQSLWFDAGRAVMNQSLNRGFHFLHPWHAGKRSQHYSWPRRPSRKKPKTSSWFWWKTRSDNQTWPRACKCIS